MSSDTSTVLDGTRRQLEDCVKAFQSIKINSLPRNTVGDYIVLQDVSIDDYQEFLEYLSSLLNTNFSNHMNCSLIDGNILIYEWNSNVHERAA